MRGAKGKSPKFAPPAGMMPALQYAPPERLLIDGSYQRSMDCAASEALVRRIAQGWNWDMCQPLVVAKRAGGGLYVIDGQHRLAAAQLRGDIHQLPCVIVDYGSPADEAAAFVALNQQRRPLTAPEIFRAAVASGDPEAIAISAAIAAAGLTLAPHSNPTAWKPGMVINVRGIQQCWRERGAGITAEALAVLAEAYDGEVLQYGGTLFPGIAAVVHRGLDFERARFVGILRGKSQVEWRQAMTRYLADNPKEARNGAMAAAMMQAWRGEGLEAEAPAPAPSASSSGRRWCRQCDGMVTRAQEIACKSRFCSLRLTA